jgi:hypothetical protein
MAQEEFDAAARAAELTAHLDDGPLRDLDEVPEDPYADVPPPVYEDGGAEDNSRPGLLPEEFWSARPTFQRIRAAAHAEARSGDVLLYTTLARLSGMLSHRIKMRTGILGRGSMNLFVALVGAPGAGKSSGASGARELIPSADPEFRDGMPLGSGEGVAEIFMGIVEEETGEFIQRGKNAGDPVTVKVRKQVRHNAFFYVDEGERLTQLAGRQGQVVSETLRSAAMGETLGQTNATEERTRYIAPGSYSLGLVIGYQPTTVTALLADGHTGTPQRFFWVWAEDPTIPFNPPDNPGPIELDPRVQTTRHAIDVEFPTAIKDLIRNERVRRAQGELEVPELDGHHRFMTAKMAGLLALLEGRFEVDEMDWKLAEMAWQASCAVRDSLVERARRETKAAKDQQAKEKIQYEVAAAKAKRGAEYRVMRIAGGVAKHVAEGGPGGLTYNGVRMKIASRDRDVLEEAIDIAVSKGWIIEDGDKYAVGPEYGKAS